jgi:Fungal specific transcription factor domain
VAQQLPTPNFDRGEGRAFSFFLQQAAPVLSGALDSDFWAQLVPQLSHSEPIIWNAVHAVSSLYEHPHVSPYPIELVVVLPAVGSHHQQALTWYNKAISNFKIYIQQKPHGSSLALLSCILFICIEFQQDNMANALALLAQGFKLLSSTPTAIHTVQNHRTIRDIVASFFARHTVIASTFGTSGWFIRVDKRMLQPYLAFSTLRDARSALYMWMEHGHAFVRMAGMRIKDHDTIEDLIPLRDNLLSKLMEWHSIFSQLDCRISTLEIRASSNLIMYHSVAIIWISTRLSLV